MGSGARIGRGSRGRLVFSGKFAGYVGRAAKAARGLGTNLITNVCIGFTNASLPTFLAASAIGYIPQMLVFNLLGVGVRVDSQAQLALSLVLLVISIALGIFLYKRQIDLD